MSTLHLSSLQVVLALSAIVGVACGTSPPEPTPTAPKSSEPRDAALYFPPSDGAWDTVHPDEVDWDAARLEAALELAGERGSSGVVVLHQGRIMAERYWEPADPSQGYITRTRGVSAAGHAIEDVASVQKSIVAVLVGIAQHRGLLSLNDPVSDYLSQWTLATLEQERAITIRHLLAMTTGLTADLEYEVEPGSTWVYNTPAYHHLMRILANAAELGRSDITTQWLTERIGMTDSGWERRPGANPLVGFGFATTARDLARFGLMILADGEWDGETIVADKRYLASMLRPSQQLNPSYGLLWWVNGQSASMSWAIPPTRTDGQLIPVAPSDLAAAQGARDRKLYVVPSLDLVVTRLGDDGSVDDSSFNDAFWSLLVGASPDRRAGA